MARRTADRFPDLSRGTLSTLILVIPCSKFTCLNPSSQCCPHETLIVTEGTSPAMRLFKPQNAASYPWPIFGLRAKQRDPNATTTVGLFHRSPNPQNPATETAYTKAGIARQQSGVARRKKSKASCPTGYDSSSVSVLVSLVSSSSSVPLSSESTTGLLFTGPPLSALI